MPTSLARLKSTGQEGGTVEAVSEVETCKRFSSRSKRIPHCHSSKEW